MEPLFTVSSFGRGFDSRRLHHLVVTGNRPDPATTASPQFLTHTMNLLRGDFSGAGLRWIQGESEPQKQKHGHEEGRQPQIPH
jgi:hypothetical protein